MNTANLQLDGLLVAMSCLIEKLRDKGLLSAGEVDEALAQASRVIASDLARNETLSPANVEAISFPVRYLQAANQSLSGGGRATFSELVARLGHLNDGAAAGSLPPALARDAADLADIRSGDMRPEGFTRDAGPQTMRDPPSNWDGADEASDESFPASDPPAKY